MQSVRRRKYEYWNYKGNDHNQVRKRSKGSIPHGFSSLYSRPSLVLVGFPWEKLDQDRPLKVVDRLGGCTVECPHRLISITKRPEIYFRGFCSENTYGTQDDCWSRFGALMKREETVALA